MWLMMELSGNGRYQRGKVRVRDSVCNSSRSITFHAKQWAGLNSAKSTTTKRYGMYLVSCDRAGIDITCWFERETAEERYYETMRENARYVWHTKSKFHTVRKGKS